MEDREIRELRASLGLSQERFAQLLGVSLQTVRRWECGSSRPLPIISLKLQELQKATRPRATTPRSIPPGGSIPVKPSDRDQPGAELGPGGVFRGLANFLYLLSKMAEEGREEATRVGTLEAGGGKLRGVYGFSVRMGLEGHPLIEQFGNLAATDAGPVLMEVREPLVDVLDEGDHIVVIVEMPGVEEKDIHLGVAGDILDITASTGDRKYQKEVLLPCPVEGKSLGSWYRNGLLEIRLAKG